MPIPPETARCTRGRMKPSQGKKHRGGTVEHRDLPKAGWARLPRDGLRPAAGAKRGGAAATCRTCEAALAPSLSPNLLLHLFVLGSCCWSPTVSPPLRLFFCYATRSLSQDTSPLIQARYVPSPSLAHFHGDHQRFCSQLRTQWTREDHHPCQPQG